MTVLGGICFLVLFLVAGKLANWAIEKAKDSRAEVTTDTESNPEESSPGLLSPSTKTKSRKSVEETIQRVESCPVAMKALSKDLAAQLARDDLHVIWLFDESLRMKDDRQEIAKLFPDFLSDLWEAFAKRLATNKASKEHHSEPFLMSIASFGNESHIIMAQPTEDAKTLTEAIGKVATDNSGIENLSQALIDIVKEFASKSEQEGRRLVLVVVSDEAGDDGDQLEQALEAIQDANGTVYVFGREAAFGAFKLSTQFTFADKATVWIPINRGPETPSIERIQRNDCRQNDHEFLSGFGPYEQMRLCHQTGGRFFLLPPDTVTRYIHREYQMKNLIGYEPDLRSRAEYLADRDNSDFRRAIWEVIQQFDPQLSKGKLPEIPEPFNSRETLSTNPARYNPIIQKRLADIRSLHKGFREAGQKLDAVEHLRAVEPSKRWQANYDLLTAQVQQYQLYLLRYGVPLHEFCRSELAQRIQENPSHNSWRVKGGPAPLVVPNSFQEEFFGITADEVKELARNSKKALLVVQQLHPDTPWAEVAEWELDREFGVIFETFRK